MNKYSFDIRDCSNLLPPVIRKGRLHRLLTILLLPGTYIHKMCLSYQYEKTYRLDHNGQVYSLEKIIREHCRSNECYITDGEYVDETMVPYDAKGDLVYYQVYMPYFDSNEVKVPYVGFGQIQNNDFIVRLPEKLQGNIDEIRLRTLIDEYKIAGKDYTIVYCL